MENCNQGLYNTLECSGILLHCLRTLEFHLMFLNVLEADFNLVNVAIFALSWPYKKCYIKSRSGTCFKWLVDIASAPQPRLGSTDGLESALAMYPC